MQETWDVPEVLFGNFVNVRHAEIGIPADSIKSHYVDVTRLAQFEFDRVFVSLLASCDTEPLQRFFVTDNRFDAASCRLSTATMMQLPCPLQQLQVGFQFLVDLLEKSGG